MSILIPPAPVGTPFGDYSWLDWYQKVRRAINDVNLINHNDLQNIQGGSSGEHYHLTAAEHTALTSGSSGTTATEVTIDFGNLPVWDKTFTIVDGAVSPTKKIIVNASGNAPSGRHSDDWQWDSITFAAVAGSGQFTLYTNCDGPVEGTRNIFYQVI